jgi:hypothetical protein
VIVRLAYGDFRDSGALVRTIAIVTGIARQKRVVRR